jgi:hypothetical protein
VMKSGQNYKMVGKVLIGLMKWPKDATDSKTP